MIKAKYLRQVANELMEEAGAEVARRARDDCEIRELMRDHRQGIAKIVALAVEISMLKIICDLPPLARSADYLVTLI